MLNVDYKSDILESSYHCMHTCKTYTRIHKALDQIYNYGFWIS